MWPLRSGNNAQAQPAPGLFQDVPSTSMNPPSPPPMIPASSQPHSAIPEEYTLDEPVYKTIWRDVVTIARNLRSVLIPFNWKFNGQAQALRNWDLWGPLVFMLVLAIVLSTGEKQASAVFATSQAVADASPVMSSAIEAIGAAWREVDSTDPASIQEAIDKLDLFQNQ
ncbi:Protein YIPF6, partial [Tetrabaena socialis]